MNHTTKREKRVRIVRDTAPANPRTEWDQIGTMACWHTQYKLGDIQPSVDPLDFIRYLAAEYVGACDADTIPAKHVNRIIEKYCILLPLYLYDHSGITMSTSKFVCPWDSGQVGYIYCSAARAKSEWGDAYRGLAERYLQSEVAVYDSYLTGNVYGYILEEYDPEHDPEGHYADEIDSCCGFYGHDPKTNGIADYLGDDAYLLDKS